MYRSARSQKYADDSSLVAPVWKGGSDTSSGLVARFLTWANCNSMSCDRSKCKELVIKKKGNSTFYPVVRNTPQHSTLDLLGLTFQNDCKFFAYAKAKLTNVYTCWEYVEKNATARQKLTISSIVLLFLIYGLPVYGISNAEINVLQQFLDRCYKLRFISTQLNIRSLLQKQDKAIFEKVKQRDDHPLKVFLPQEKNNFTSNLRRKSCQKSKINTERYIIRTHF